MSPNFARNRIRCTYSTTAVLTAKLPDGASYCARQCQVPELKQAAMRIQVMSAIVAVGIEVHTR